MKKVALSVTLKAKRGKEDAVAAFLATAQSLVAQEPGTISWFAFRVDQRTFGILDSFGGDAARQAHLQGAVAARPPWSRRGPARRLARDPPGRHSGGKAACLSGAPLAAELREKRTSPRP